MALFVCLGIGEALVLDEGVTGSFPGDDLVVVGAVRKDFSKAIFVDLGGQRSTPGGLQHHVHHLF